MSITKTKREKKRQLGQFLTPSQIAYQIVDQIRFNRNSKVLEPSMGDGSFVIPIILKFIDLYDGPIKKRLDTILSNNVYGVEIDKQLYRKCLLSIKQKWNYLPNTHNLINKDFFQFNTKNNLSRPITFSHIIGNPPFGGTLDPKIQDDLDKEFGFRNGEKIKKETYSFFIVKSIDLLQMGGKIIFICSDTFLTIKTMRGLRKLLMASGLVKISDLEYFSEETKHPMVILDFVKGDYTNSININRQNLDRSDIELTDNFSWKINGDLTKYFSGPKIGQFMIATSGMTVGKNEYFVRKIVDGKIREPFRFKFYEETINLKKEVECARLGKLAPSRILKIKRQESEGRTKRNVRVIKRDMPVEISIPHPDYCYYNKAIREIVYAPPTHVIYWKDEGDAVLTFKKNGNWYLRGVGGQRYFRRSGLTWQLIAQNLNMRYLPKGYILDSGAPCAFLRDGIQSDELYFIFGWALTQLCNYLLKEVINHTRNIQGKDFERLPYPFWVSKETKDETIAFMRDMVKRAMNGHRFVRSGSEIDWLENKYAYTGEHIEVFASKSPAQTTLPLFNAG